MLILGISFSHGSAAVLVDDGKVLAAIEEEKLNRIKGYIGFPYLSVQYVLSSAGCNIDDVDRVALGCTNISEFSNSFYNLVKVISRQKQYWTRKRAALVTAFKRMWPS